MPGHHDIRLKRAFAIVPIVLLLGLSTLAVAGSPGNTLSIASQLSEMLQNQGWIVTQDPSGNRLFSRPPVAPPAAVAPPVPPQPTMDQPRTVAPLTDVQALLRERGWRIDTTPSGETLLLPVRPATAAGSGPQGKAPIGSRDTQSATAEASAAQRAATPEHSDSAPAAGPTMAPPAPKPDNTEPCDSGETVVASSIDSLLGVLQERGWQVHTDEDGVITLYPPGLDRGSYARRDAVERGYCAGVSATDLGAPSMTDNGVSHEIAARKLAYAWNERFGQPYLAVGAARRIGPVFLVGILDPRRGYTPRNLLVVRRDGSIVSLR